MDFDKSILVDEFIRYKNVQKNVIFSVHVDFFHDTNHWLPFGESDLEIQNNISKDDYTFIFMDELIGAKPYLGNFVFDMDYLEDVCFDGHYLMFSHEGKKVRIC